MSDPSKSSQQYIAGRGAQINPANPFDSTFQEEPGQIWNDEDEFDGFKKTHYLETHPKSIINRVESPDVPFAYSMNPYQGCEHGCVYCYARNTHTYWGYSAGIEFEQKILVKHNAPELLEKQLRSKKWVPLPIMLSGNTDCYQPAERKYKLTRQLLEIAWRYKHPIALITKNSLILRDLDLLKQMASKDLIHVAITITTLEEDLRQKLEPRTATGLKRIEVIRQLSEAGVPVNVMMGPIIPSMTDYEIPNIAKAASEAGARELHYTILRLNGDVAIIFKDWLQKNFPDRYDRVIHQTEDLHGGQVNDSRFKKRMRGEGQLAEMIKQQIALARRQYFKGRSLPKLNTALYLQKRDPQMKLF